MFPSELQLQAQRDELLRQAEQQRLARFVTDGRPTLWQRLRAHLHLNSTEIVTFQAREPIKGYLIDQSRAFD